MNASGDDGYAEYVRARWSAMLGTALTLTGNRADAEDLVQATLAKTYLAWHRIQDRAALDIYVRRAMVNTHISSWRRRRVEEYPTDELPELPTGDHATDTDLHEVVQRAVDRLPRRMRAAVMLRYYEDMTEPEIAAALGVSLGTVKSTVARAVAKLRADAELYTEQAKGPAAPELGREVTSGTEAGLELRCRVTGPKAARAGVPVAYVDPAYTSQACSGCGHIDKRNPPDQATFRCTSCGFAERADVNAARNIASRGAADWAVSRAAERGTPMAPSHAA